MTQKNDLNSDASANAGAHFGSAQAFNPQDVITQLLAEWKGAAASFNSAERYFETDDDMTVGKTGDRAIGLVVNNFAKPHISLMSMDLQLDSQRGYVLGVAAQQNRNRILIAHPVQEQIFPATPEGAAELIEASRAALERDFPGLHYNKGEVAPQTVVAPA